MNAPIIVEDVITLLQRRYGKPAPFGRSRMFKFGAALACSINYSKLLGTHKYFFGLSREVVDPNYTFPETNFGDFVLLICGSINTILVLPRKLIVAWMRGVSSRRIDIFYENGTYVLQTTKHPKLNVTEFLNAFPKQSSAEHDAIDNSQMVDQPDRMHVKIQWALIQLGRAEGCSILGPIVKTTKWSK